MRESQGQPPEQKQCGGGIKCFTFVFEFVLFFNIFIHNFCLLSLFVRLFKSGFSECSEGDGDCDQDSDCERPLASIFTKFSK